MVDEEFFVHCYNFKPTVLLKSKKVIFKVHLIQLSVVGAGAKAEIRICCSVKPEPEPREIFRLRNTGRQRLSFIDKSHLSGRINTKLKPRFSG
jgi:hypothetical protein